MHNLCRIQVCYVKNTLMSFAQFVTGGSMYFKIMKNDMLKSKMITLTITLFIATAAMLVSLAAVLVIHLFEAETPHFMQMHTGEIDMSRLTSFAQQNSDVHQFQVAEFLNGEQIISFFQRYITIEKMLNRLR